MYHRGFLVILLTVAIFIGCGTRDDKPPRPFVKGVYGNPGALLEAGYSFKELGMNAVFVRSISLNRAFYDAARREECAVFVEFPTLLGKDYLEHHPEAWPLNQRGERAPAADWFMGICPTDSVFKRYRADQLKAILTDYDVDGIFLDYFHWHAQFETPEPILPETCFCNRCTTLFGSNIGEEIPGDDVAEKASWILSNRDADWRRWRSAVLQEWASDMKGVVKSIQPEALMGIYHCGWFASDYDSALYRVLGIDVPSLAAVADVLSPMLFHRMKGRPVEWVGEYLSWMDEATDASRKGSPLVWPIVQAHNHPGVVTAEEFREVMRLGMGLPASGIMMFSDVALVEDSMKVRVMRELFREVEISSF
jgi:hypothetical protein